MSNYKECYNCLKKFRYSGLKKRIKCKGCLNKISINICKDLYQKKTKKKLLLTHENNKNFKDKKINICSICYENHSSIAFIPCGHLCCCAHCAPLCNNKCPICRENSFFTQKIYVI